MAREGLSFALGSAFQKAITQEEAVTVKDLKVGINGGTQLIEGSTHDTEKIVRLASNCQFEVLEIV